MKFNPGVYRYPSQRRVVYANKGMVCSSTPQAAQAGLAALRRGGNAIDAAVAAAAALPVVEPTGNGIGGDAFALVWSGGKLHGLNASGPAGREMTAAKIRGMGHEEMPKYGWMPVTVPGIPSAWAALNKRFGKLSLSDCMAPAIEYARDGFPLSTTVGRLWQRAYSNFKNVLDSDMYEGWRSHFSVDGRCPATGDVWRSEHTAKTLESIAATGAESFYRGELMERIINFSNKTGGYLTQEDFTQFSPEWVEPISTNYRGYDVWEIPPNGHGIATLIALNILEGFELFGGRETGRSYHLQIEAMKLALTDAKKYVADSSCMSVKPQDLLSKSYAAGRRELIGDTAVTPEPGVPFSGGTVYLCAADSEGNMISYIQSNYMGFGSGLVVPETGIALHNRGNNFMLDDNHDNCFAPGKRPYHTIIPGFMTKENKPIGPFGVMGGFMQPQAHLQVVCNTVDFGMNPQDALNAPRWLWNSGKKLDLEHTVPYGVMQELADMGHEVNILLDPATLGRGQIIWRMENDVLCGGTEPRTDGTVAVY